MPATDVLRATVAGYLAQTPVVLANGLPSVPLYIALGNGTGTHGPTDLSLFAEVYGTRLRYSYESVYQAYTAQITENYTVSNPTGTFTEAGLFDQPVSQTTLSAAVSAGATTLPVTASTSPAVYGGTQAGQYTTAYINDSANPEYIAIAVSATAGASSWTLQSGLQYAHASGTPVVVFTGNLLAAVSFQTAQVNQAGQQLTVQWSLKIASA